MQGGGNGAIGHREDGAGGGDYQAEGWLTNGAEVELADGIGKTALTVCKLSYAEFHFDRAPSTIWQRRNNVNFVTI